MTTRARRSFGVPVNRTFATFAALAAFAACLVGCGGSNPFVMGAYDTMGGTAYICSLSAGGGSGQCVPDTTSDETRWRKPGTVYVPFEAPLAQCDKGIHRILIENPKSGYTNVLIECVR
jgi:hypothetical protein